VAYLKRTSSSLSIFNNVIIKLRDYTKRSCWKEDKE